jgi:hypothetical protein
MGVVDVEFVDNTAKVNAAIREKGIAWLYEASGELEAQTKRNSKVKTGKTKGSYSYKVDEGSLEGAIGSNYENAIYEEYGTGEYALNGDGRKGGWFYKDSSGHWYHTYGKSPRRPFYKAYMALKSRLISRAQDLFGGIG